MLRSTWDYAERRDEFLDWAERLPRVLNPFPVLHWNTDKQQYLTDLEAAGVPIVPTRFLEPGSAPNFPPAPFVVKPAISAGGRSSGRFEVGEEGAAEELVRRIYAEGRTAMAQPYLGDADGRGETGLAYIAGSYSHAVSRRVPLPRATEAGPGLYLEERLGRREATSAERAVADAAIACAPGAGGLLYARVDLLRDDHGDPVVLELELAEPSLYLAYADGAAEVFADAIAAAV